MCIWLGTFMRYTEDLAPEAVITVFVECQDAWPLLFAIKVGRALDRS